MKKPLVIAVVGSKSSGKTTTIETITKELTKRGYKIAAIKHIPEPNFTIDKAGKDTWRFAQSGAKTIISVASNEIATIEKTDTENFSLKEILKKCKGHDIIFVEGFGKLVGKDKGIYKIAVVKFAEEASEAIKNFEPLLAFTGPFSTEAVYPKIPYVDLMKNPEKITEIVEKVVKGLP
ncbi:MAG: molybdopterin-guanine dinucleotide biosynthesis protein B [Candidatus Bathyarchaeota archaeon]|jgi:molybdopterin-guanine dinucleotide biosynthesis protein B|nr:molybdopterin-guanine dinucleotide biosynthesis protein B [Candidatus Bathyarchaeota archaeon]